MSSRQNVLAPSRCGETVAPPLGAGIGRHSSTGSDAVFKEKDDAECHDGAADGSPVE